MRNVAVPSQAGVAQLVELHGLFERLVALVDRLFCAFDGAGVDALLGWVDAGYTPA